MDETVCRWLTGAEPTAADLETYRTKQQTQWPAVFHLYACKNTLIQSSNDQAKGLICAFCFYAFINLGLNYRGRRQTSYCKATQVSVAAATDCRTWRGGGHTNIHTYVHKQRVMITV